MCNWMIERKDISMKTKASYWVITITIFCISTHGMSHVGRVHTNLIFTACFELILYKCVISGAFNHVKMRYCILSSVVEGTRIGYKHFIVFQPIGYGSFIFVHFSTHNSHITTIINDVMPVFFK